MSKELFIPSKYCTEKENRQIKDYLNLSRKNDGNMEGMVAVIHETKDGKRELLPPTHNHIVLTGRRWVMQACMNQNFNETVQQKDWVMQWFGVGSGGTVAATPGIPLDTADITTDLSNPVNIRPTTPSDPGLYNNDKLRKLLYTTTGNWVEMSYSEARGEVMMLAQLQLGYDDCPYASDELSVPINELALYASPSSLASETKFLLFSRYCRPTLYKTQGDSYLFLWYIYF